MAAIIRALWTYRGFILGSVKREFESRYRNSLLGGAWAVLNPLAMIVVYTVIFSAVMRARLPQVNSTFAYSIYLCAGVLSWGLFSDITSKCQNIFVEQANLLKKLSFPKLCLPVIVVITACIDFLIIFSLFSIFLIVTGNFPGIVYFAMIIVLAMQVAFAVGLGVSLGVLNVFFRDVGQLFGVILQFWFWLTPIVYPASVLPKEVHALLFRWNPMAPIVAAEQGILLSGIWPNWTTLAIPAGLAIALCLLGLYLFRVHAGEIVDEL